MYCISYAVYSQILSKTLGNDLSVPIHRPYWTLHDLSYVLDGISMTYPAYLSKNLGGFCGLLARLSEDLYHFLASAHPARTLKRSIIFTQLVLLRSIRLHGITIG